METPEKFRYEVSLRFKVEAEEAGQVVEEMAAMLRADPIEVGKRVDAIVRLI